MNETDRLIAGFDDRKDKIAELDRIGASCQDDRAARLYLSVATSDKYDFDTRLYAVRLLRYAFPDSAELEQAVVAESLKVATDRAADEEMRLAFLEVILFSDRSQDTVLALVRIMADATDSRDVRQLAFVVLEHHLDKEMIGRAVALIEVRDVVFDDYCSTLLGREG